MRNSLILLALNLALIAIPPTECKGQFYKVYGYETLEQGEIEGVLWTSHIVQGDGSFSFFETPAARDGLWAHSLEIEYGLTDRITLAARTDFLDPKDRPFKYVRARAVLLRYRLAEPGKFFFDPAIFIEYHLPRESFSDAEKLELRLILERPVSDGLVLRLNPIFEMATSGSEVEEGLGFVYAAGIYYTRDHKIQPGLELYGELGELSHPEPLKYQEIGLFPTVDVHVAALHWHIGLGFGLTNASDEITIKSILSYGF